MFSNSFLAKRFYNATHRHEEAQSRHIYLNRLQPTKFRTNEISTAKYNVLTFVPRFLFDQFRRYSNIFFLAIALLQQIPDVSPTGRYVTAIPLVFILIVSAGKELIEDFKRHRADRKTNHSRVLVLRSGQWVLEKWEQIHVGDFVKVVRDQFFPADLIILSSSEPQAMAYIETSNLDGETNLKIRQGLSQTATLLSHEDLYAVSGAIECEAPNRNLYEFSGNIRLDNKEAVSLGAEQVLQRGARLKNTNWAFGVVVYTGHETKLMKNTSLAPLKRSNVDHVTNSQVFMLFIMLLVTAVISAIASQIWASSSQEESWYLGMHATGITNFGYSILTFVILYNNLIPISLQVSLEVVRFFQAIFINSDMQMYYEPNDQPALARTSNLNEELGQVKYVFTDKTGTLTENIMNFKKCSIAGIVYGTDTSLMFDDVNLLQNLRGKHVTASVIHEFLTLLSVCHTVVPEKEADSAEVTFQASSPDEGALVRGAKSQGFVFHTRTPDAVIINAQGIDERYEVLNVLEFNSDRKRMSVVVKCPNGKMKLYTKGADTAIYERLAENQTFADITLKHLEAFAETGYRTLCIAKADISFDFYETWRKTFYEASIAIHDRERKLSDAAELIEKNLVLLGATAIEDKLQEGVPETIAALLKADIRVWMLTGDKQETAINIGHSCRLITPGMPVLILNRSSMIEMRELVRQYSNDLGSISSSSEHELALVLTGNSLIHALHPEIRREFLNLALCCHVVICCRVTPMQKAEVVELVKHQVGAITLAIGDGANDVAMIQAAHVGIGIAGLEGLQAACASDYAIARFRFLIRLLFVHGAWSFHRIVRLILYSFYKNICLYIIELWFAIFSAWSGQVIFERWSIGMYNVLFTMAPPLVIGLFDRTASAETMIRYPSLYTLSQNRDSFNVKIFWLYISNAILHSLMLFWLGKLIFDDGIVWEHGKNGGLFLVGNSIYTYVVVAVSLKAGLELDTWTWPCHAAIWGSIAAWLIFIVVYSNVYPLLPIGPEMAGMDVMLYSSVIFWAGFMLVPITTVFVDFAGKIIRRTLFKTVADEVRELEISRLDPSSILPRLNRSRPENGGGVSPVSTAPSTPSTTASVSGLLTNGLSETARLLRHAFSFKRTTSGGGGAPQDSQRGYAFSQEEYGAVTQSQIVRAYDSTRAKPSGH